MLLASLTSAAAASPSVGADASADTVLRIGQERYDSARFQALSRALQPDQRQPLPAAELPDALIQDYARSRLLAAQARAHGLQDNPQVAAQLQVHSDQILAEAERQRLMASAAIDPVTTRHYFDQHAGDFDEYHLRHILIAIPPGHNSRDGHRRNEAQALAHALELRQQLLDGADFADLAQRQSDDEASAGDGGEVSPMFGRYLAADFSAPVRALKPGEVSAPVRSAAGYHLIKLEQRNVASFAQAQPMIEAQLRSDAVDQAIAALLHQYPVQLDRRALSITPAPSASATP